MRGDTATKRRSRSPSSLGAPACDHIHDLKRSKKSSSTKLMNIINIDDLPDVVLAEILCRLPSNKLVVQCRCVSKRWCTLISLLISDPYFIGRFLRLQIDKRTPRTSTLINPKGEEILTGMWSPVFKELKTFHGLKEEPFVAGTYNDLVLCCASQYHQRHYYICNPYTRQWVALPPTPTEWEETVSVGFICDIPYYNYKEDDDRKGSFNIVQVNAEYRCMVVRIIPPQKYYKKYRSFKLQLELFSSETGEWRESVVSSPLGARYITEKIIYAYNGMLYWRGDMAGRLVGLDPFVINDITSTNTSCSNGDDDIIDYYRCRLVDDLALTVNAPSVVIQFFGVHGGWLRMCDFNNRCMRPFGICVWELKEEQDHGDHMLPHGTGKFCLKDMTFYSLDENMLPDDDTEPVELLAFDPNNGDIMYLNIDEDIVRCNFRTRKWSKLAAGKSKVDIQDDFLPLVLPWWPTPVPRLPPHASPPMIS